MKFEIAGIKYQLVFEYQIHDTGKHKWTTIGQAGALKGHVKVLVAGVEQTARMRVQHHTPIFRKTVTCKLLRWHDGIQYVDPDLWETFVEATIRVNPALGNSKEVLRLEALHACMADMTTTDLISGQTFWIVGPHDYEASAEAKIRCGRIRAAMWRIYSERRIICRACEHGVAICNCKELPIPHHQLDFGTATGYTHAHSFGNTTPCKAARRKANA